MASRTYKQSDAQAARYEKIRTDNEAQTKAVKDARTKRPAPAKQEK